MTRLRATFALFILAATVLLAIGAGAPAQASDCPFGPGVSPCDVYPWEVPVFDDGCPRCPEAMEFQDEAQWAYGPLAEHLDAGLLLLSKAVHADKAAAADLRARALKEFTAAAELTGGGLKVVAVGRIDAKTGAFEPQPFPWLSAAAVHLENGLAMLAGGIPMPEPALGEFDAALDDLLQG